MDLVNEIETAAANCPNKLHVIYANLQEANLGADQLQADQYPCLVVLPPIFKDARGTSGLWQSKVAFDAMILFKDYDAKTSEYVTKDVEQKFVQNARKIGRQFLNRLLASSVIDKSQLTGITATFTPTYGEFDAHLHGAAVKIDIPVLEGTTCSIAVVV